METTRTCPVWEIALRSKLQRPYVNEELEDIRQRTTRFRRLSDVMIRHKDCQHAYRVKKFGHKERTILDGGGSDGGDDRDIGRCSVCWRSEREIDPPMDLIDEYEWIVSDTDLPPPTPTADQDMKKAKQSVLAKLLGNNNDDTDADLPAIDSIDSLIYDPQRSASWDSLAPRAVLVEKAFYEWLYQ